VREGQCQLRDTVPPTPVRPAHRNPQKKYGRLPRAQWSASSPSPSALCGHPHHCAAIPSTAMPSPSLWEPRTTRRCHPRHCTPPAFRQLPSRRRTDDDSSGRRPHSHTRSRSWAGTGFATTPAGGEICQDDQQLRVTAHHTAICSLRIVRRDCKPPPLVYKRRGRSPGRGGGGRAAHLCIFRLHHDIGTRTQSNPRDLEASPPLPPRL
jgi:hypothetical protein